MGTSSLVFMLVPISHARSHLSQLRHKHSISTRKTKRVRSSCAFACLPLVCALVRTSRVRAETCSKGAPSTSRANRLQPTPTSLLVLKKGRLIAIVLFVYPISLLITSFSLFTCLEVFFFVLKLFDDTIYRY